MKCCYGIVVVLILGLSAAVAQADSLDLGVGAFDVLDRSPEGPSTALRLEYRWEQAAIAMIRPLAGLLGNADGGVYAYAGAYVPFELGQRWTLLPNLAVGAYEQGDGRDLGGVLQFQPGLDLYYRLSDRHFVGVSFRHLSNARVYQENPGVETLMLRYGHHF